LIFRLRGRRAHTILAAIFAARSIGFAGFLLFRAALRFSGLVLTFAGTAFAGALVRLVLTPLARILTLTFGAALAVFLGAFSLVLAWLLPGFLPCSALIGLIILALGLAGLRLILFAALVVLFFTTLVAFVGGLGIGFVLVVLVLEGLLQFLLRIVRLGI